MTGHVDPTRAQLRAAIEAAGDGPVIMINLLRFAADAAYPADSGHAPCTGREAYARYIKHAGAFIEKVGGEVIWQGKVTGCVIAPETEAWDQAFGVRYPSAKAFLDMVQNPDYQAQTVHRTAALADSRLIMTQPDDAPPRPPTDTPRVPVATG